MVTVFINNWEYIGQTCSP